MENLNLKERLAAKNEVVLNEKNFVALEQNSLEIIRENLKNQPLSMSLFDIVKSPSGARRSFLCRVFRARKQRSRSRE